MSQFNLSAAVQLYGSGGHAVVVAAAAQADGRQVLAVYDDDPTKWGTRLAGIEVSGYDLGNLPSVPLVIALGDNILRERVAAHVGHLFGQVFHPSVLLAKSATVAEGSQLLARVVVNEWAQIGRHTILNTGCIVEHHVAIGDFVHLAPGAILCGNCRIGSGTVIGPGAVVVKGKHVGQGCVVAAGAVVVSDVPDGSRVQGVPGRIVPLESVSADWS